MGNLNSVVDLCLVHKEESMKQILTVRVEESFVHDLAHNFPQS